MNAPHNPAQARAWRKRTAAVFAAVGALIFSSGIVILTAPAASAATKIGVCHRKANGTYVLLNVSSNAGTPRGHETHLPDGDGYVPAHPDYLAVPAGVTLPLAEWCESLNQDDNGGGDDGGDNGDGGGDNGDGGGIDRVELAGVGYEPIAGCGTWASITPPTDTAQVTYSVPTGQVSQLEGVVTVTATLVDAADRFVRPLPEYWELDEVDGDTATWTYNFGDTTECVYGTVATPRVTENDGCDVQGSVQKLSDANSVHYAIEGGDWNVTEGDHTITATLANGAVAFSKPLPAEWNLAEDELSATYLVRLGTLAAGCGGSGGGNTGGNGNGGGGGQTPGTPPVTIPNPELIPVTPNYAKATEATCSQRGALIVPNQPAGVLVSRTGSAPGTVTFTYAADAGYAFSADTVTTQNVRVDKKLEGDACILGDEEVKPTHTGKPTHHAKPKPRDRGPVVLGTQAAVPTAVDAGLGSLPTAVVSPSGSPRLAQALVAGGLLMLVAGGSMGLGRRTRGAHES